MNLIDPRNDPSFHAIDGDIPAKTFLLAKECLKGHSACFLSDPDADFFDKDISRVVRAK